MSILVDLVKEDFGITGNERWWRSEVHSSLVVDAEKDVYFFNARDLRGDVVHYLMNVRGLDRRKAEEFVKNRSRLNSGVPDETGGLQVKYDRLVDLFHSAGKNNRDYWYRRNLTDSTIDRYRLGYYDGWYLIPIYDNGLFVNFQCRRDNPKRFKLWYKDKDFKPVLYNSDILKFVDRVYIVEGMVDCILLNQLGLPSVCSTNGAGYWNPGWIRYFTKINDIFYIEDHDKAGEAASSLVSNSLGPSRVKVVSFDGKPEKYDSVDFFRDGGSKESFLDLINHTYRFQFEKGLT